MNGQPRLLADVNPAGGGGGRLPWPNTGNEQISPNPQSLPGRGDYSGAIGTPFGPNGVPAPLPGTQQVVQPALYLTFNGLGFVLAADGDSNLMLNEPSVRRGYLEIRNSATSTGALCVGLDNTPTSDATSDFIIAPGESKVFDDTVPQNRLYGFALGGPVTARIISANTSY